MLEFTQWLNCNHFTFWALSSANGFNSESALTLAIYMEEHEIEDEAWIAHAKGGMGLMTGTMVLALAPRVRSKIHGIVQSIPREFFDNLTIPNVSLGH